MALVWPLVGRDEELRFVAAALRPRGGPSGVVLAGAAGVGKTRLAREAAQRAGGRAAVRWAYGTASARSAPLGAFEPLLGDLGPDHAGIVSRIVDRLGSQSGPRPLIAVDDAHLLDPLSAHLVQQLVLREAACVLVTLRSGSRTPDAITSLWKDEHLPRLEVQPLSEAESARLLERVLDGPLESSAAARFWALSQGNLLFLRHLADGELRAGRLRRAAGVWQWPASGDLTAELTDLVRADMGTLTADVREVVDLLALGEPLTLQALAGLADPAVIEAAESRGLVRIAHEPRAEVRLAHPLYGEVRRAEMGQLRARRLRGLLATTLATGPASEPLRAAVLAMDSDVPPEPARLVAAAQEAIRRFDLSLGERLAQAAIDASGGRLAFEAMLTRAFALSWLSRGDECEAILAQLASIAPNDKAWTIATGGRLGNLFWTLRRATDAQQLLAQGLARLSEPHRSHLVALGAAFDAALGRPLPAIDAALTVLDSPGLPPIVRLMASVGATMGGGVSGRLGLARRAAELGYEAASSAAEGGIPRFGLALAHSLAERLAGELRAADGAAARVQQWTADVLGPAHLMGLTVIGHAALARGRVRTAARRLREAWPGLQATGHEFGFVCRIYLIHALALCGESTAAREFLVEAETDRHPASTALEPDLVLARAWIAASEGAGSEAVTTALRAAEVARRQDSPAFEAMALQTALQFGDHTVGSRLHELAGLVEGARAPTAARHADALAAGDGDRLAAAASEWEELGDNLAAADAAAQAARAFGRAGRRGSAVAATTRALHLAERCEGARTPALAAVARPLPLSSREREIVVLAAAGASNREIAERLTLSVRTVEGHLYRASAKLGAHDRHDLAAILDGRAITPPG